MRFTVLSLVALAVLASPCAYDPDPLDATAAWFSPDVVTASPKPLLAFAMPENAVVEPR